MEFKEWFCLKDRESFTIDPKITPSDAQFYFGRQEIDKRLKAQIRRAFIDPGVPKMMVWGPYGSGKTQTLYYLEHYLKTTKIESSKLTPRMVHVDIEVQSKATCASWHLQLIEALGRDVISAWVAGLFGKTPDFDSTLATMLRDPNAAEAVKNLRAGGPLGFSAWRWLTGQKLSSKELEELKVTRNVGDIGAGDMVSVLEGIGRLAESQGQKLIFLIDEMEELQNVREGDAAQSWHQYLRRLSEQANSTVGFIIGFKADTLNEGSPILTREDVRSRLGEQNYVEIPHLSAISDVKAFVLEMLKHLVHTEKANKRIQERKLGVTVDTYPFSSSAFDLLCDYASQDPVKALPRNLIKAINECAIAAWDEKKEILDDKIVNDIAPLVFG